MNMTSLFGYTILQKLQKSTAASANLLTSAPVAPVVPLTTVFLDPFASPETGVSVCRDAVDLVQLLLAVRELPGTSNATPRGRQGAAADRFGWRFLEAPLTLW